MKKTPALDANIILRFLTNDDPKKADACTSLLERLERNETQVWLPDLALADIIWTLEKFYRLSKTKINDLLTPIINLPGLHYSNKDTAYTALAFYTRYNIDWTDAIIAAQVISKKTEVIYSYDRDFDKIPGITRMEP